MKAFRQFLCRFFGSGHHWAYEGLIAGAQRPVVRVRCLRCGAMDKSEVGRIQ